MDKFYGLTDSDGKIISVFKLGLPEGGITEAIWNARSHAWEDCSPTLVGWLTFGKANLEPLVSEQVAAVFPGSTKSYSVKYSPDQERDDHGRFGSGGGGGAADAAGNLKEPDGGFTYDPRSGTFATTGFAVSTNPERGQVIANVASMKTADLAKQITAYAKTNADIFAEPGTHIGAWHDPETGEGDLDVSRVVATHEEAQALAQAHNQIAYFDLAKGESVTVNRDATGSRKDFNPDEPRGADGKWGAGAALAAAGVTVDGSVSPALAKAAAGVITAAQSQGLLHKSTLQGVKLQQGVVPSDWHGGGESQGSFDSQAQTLTVDPAAISRAGGDVSEVLAHEMGHAVDFNSLGEGRFESARGRPSWDPFYAAAEKSNGPLDIYQQLRPEVFARAYSQALGYAKPSAPGQWSEADFPPVKAELEKLVKY